MPLTKKRRRVKETNRNEFRTHWRVSDADELLAYLAFGASACLSKEVINEGAARNLKTRYGLIQTSQQIEAKLRSLWSVWGEEGADDSDFQRLYKEGPWSLRYFKSKEHADQIRLRADELTAQSLRSADEKLATPRTLRSGSTPGTARQPGVRLTRSARQTLTPNFLGRDDSFVQTPSRARRQMLVASELTTPSSMEGDENQIFKTEACPDSPPLQEVELYITTSLLGSLAREDLDIGSDRSIPETFSQIASGSSIEIASVQSGSQDGMRLEDDQPSPLGRLGGFSLTLENRIYATCKRKNKDIRYWKERALAVEAKLEEAELINSNLRAQVGAVKKGDLKFLERVQMLETQTIQLEAQNSQLISKLHSWTSSQGNHSKQVGYSGINVTDIDHSMIALREAVTRLGQNEDVETTLSMCDMESLLASMTYSLEATTDPARRACRDVEARDEFRTSALNTGATFEGIVGLAVTYWALAADIRDFFWDTTLHRGHQNPYDVLCELISQKDSEFCRTLDFQVHQKLRQDSYIEDLCVNQLASNHAESLVDLLLRLKQDGRCTFDNGSVGRIREHLTSIFQQALRLRGKLIMSAHHIELRMYPPATVFDDDCMVSSVGGEARPMGQRDICGLVKATLLPAILMTKEDRMRVQYCIDLSSNTCRDTECWSKAFVAI